MKPGWAQSTAPVECKAPADTGEKVTALATDARAFAKLVEASGTDDDVKAALGRIHDQFEAVHMACLSTGNRRNSGAIYGRRRISKSPLPDVITSRPPPFPMVPRIRDGSNRPRIWIGKSTVT